MAKPVSPCIVSAADFVLFKNSSHSSTKEKRSCNRVIEMRSLETGLLTRCQYQPPICTNPTFYSAHISPAPTNLDSNLTYQVRFTQTVIYQAECLWDAEETDAPRGNLHGLRENVHSPCKQHPRSRFERMSLALQGNSCASCTTVLPLNRFVCKIKQSPNLEKGPDLFMFSRDGTWPADLL